MTIELGTFPQGIDSTTEILFEGAVVGTVNRKAQIISYDHDVIVYEVLSYEITFPEEQPLTFRTKAAMMEYLSTRTFPALVVP